MACGALLRRLCGEYSGSHILQRHLLRGDVLVSVVGRLLLIAVAH